MFEFFAKIFGYVLNFIYNYVNNYGLAILIFTIILGVSGIFLIFVNYFVWFKYKKNKDEYKVSGTLTEE